jgi:dephospho-CoA kinase
VIVGLSGKKQSGKTTAAKYLVEKYGFVRVNFKDALLKELEERFPDLLKEIALTLDTTFYDGTKRWTVARMFEEKPPLIRTLMQNFGTEVRRKDHEDYWVVKWLKEVQKYQNVVVDDVRFLNEAQAVHDVFGNVIRIIREDMVTTDGHQSETEMDHIVPDYTISIKTGEHDVLYTALDEFISSRIHS